MKLPELFSRLEARYPADTPVALVFEAGYPTEKVLRAMLGTLAKVAPEGLSRLYLLYVGDGLNLRANSP